MTELRVPSESLYEPWRAAVADFAGTAMDGSGAWNVPDLAADQASFEALMAVIEREGDTSLDPGPDRVHCTYSWVFDGPGDEAEMVGFVALRHSIDHPFLRKAGGHIGYSVRPSRRREGHAARALGLALAQARALGIESALLTCDEDNAGSAATIEANGGVLENVLEGKRRYWVPTS